MTTYALQSSPWWYIPDETGQPNVGGSIAFVSQTNPKVFVNVFQDSMGTIPWANPSKIPSDGQAGPFYFISDGSVSYQVNIYDAEDNLIDVFNLPITTGGGTPINNNYNLNHNYINNSSFRYHNLLGSPITANQEINIAPDWYFILDTQQTGDSITFPQLTLSSAFPANSPDFNPEYVFNYTNSATPVGETQKDLYYRFNDVKSFNQKPISIGFYYSGTPTTTANIYWQFNYGTGFIPTYQFIGTITFTSAYQLAQFPNFIPPSISGSTRGANDSANLIIRLPLNTAGSWNIGCVQLVSGTVLPPYVYESPSDTDYRTASPNNYFLTGAVQYTYATSLGPQWLQLDDTNIGSTGSSATHKGSNFYNLYELLWNNVSAPSGNINCPVSGGLGATPAADWTANKTLELPPHLGRAPANIGQPTPPSSDSPFGYSLGEFDGHQTVTQSLGQLAQHNHAASTTIIAPGNVAFNIGSSTPAKLIAQAINSGGPSQPLVFSTTISTVPGSPTSPMFTLSPFTFMNAFIKL